MRTTHCSFVTALGLAIFTAAPAMVYAQFAFTTNNGTVTITGYTGPSGAVTIPNAINSLPVTSIGAWAFQHTGLTSITIPNRVTNMWIADRKSLSGSRYVLNASRVIPDSGTGTGREHIWAGAHSGRFASH